MTNKKTVSCTATTADENIYTLRNARDMQLMISDRGASLVSWLAPDRYGRVGDVLLAYAEASSYVENPFYFGAIIGRWANRIAAGQFKLDGRSYAVECNDGGNNLHGGSTGFHTARWLATEEEGSLRMSLTSPDGEGGFPGNLKVQVIYRLDDEGRLTIDYEAQSDAPTPINLTSHPYFNLNAGTSDIKDHLLSIDASHYLKIDEASIPIELASVAGSAFDFRQPAPIGPRLNWPDQQILIAGGFNHCYCVQEGLNGRPGPLREVASVYDPGSGRKLSVATDQAGLQFYSGNFLNGVAGRDAHDYARHDGFCLEAQAYPNQINGPYAEAVILRPGQVYRQTTVYRVSLQS
ncbi:aldose epimerase family protein [Undibacterium sp. Ji50W]|uniref:aldose epimerase family protein n=1 Tax=Undibacterium sp. Ji50W TaxID=3413041 RepID=UPI003BF1EAE8